MKRHGGICIIVAGLAALSTFAVSSSVGLDVETVEVEENANLTLICNSSEPAANLTDYYWIRNSTDGEGTSHLYASTRTLHFVHVLENVSALYTCHALDTLLGENVTVMAVKVDVLTTDEPTGNSVSVYIVVGCCVAGVCVILLFWSAFSRGRNRTYRFAGSDALGPSRDPSTERWKSLRSVYGGSSHLSSSWRPHGGNFLDSHTATKPRTGSYVYTQSHNSAHHHQHSGVYTYARQDVKAGLHTGNHAFAGPHHDRVTFNDGPDDKEPISGGITAQGPPGGASKPQLGTNDVAAQSDRRDVQPSTMGDGRPRSPFGGAPPSSYGSTLPGRPHSGYRNDGFEHDNVVDHS